MNNKDLYVRLSCLIVRALKKAKEIIVVTLIVGVAFDIGRTFFYSPSYSSSISCYFVNENGNTYSDLEAVTTYIKSMQYIFNSQAIQAGVKEKIGIDSTSMKCYVTSSTTTNIATIQVIANTRREAYIGLNYILDWYEANQEDYKFNYKIQTVSNGTLSTQPVSTNSHKKNLVIGFAIGLILSLASVMGYGYFSSTVKTPNDINQKINSRLYAKLPREKKGLRLFKKKKAILITSLKTSFLYRESINKLRSRLQQSAKKHQYKVISVTSSLENEGKSSVAVNLALALSKNNNKVLIIDSDIRKPSIHLIFEQKNITTFINHYLDGTDSLDSVIIKDVRDNLDCIFAKKNTKKAEEYITGIPYKNLFKELKADQHYDYIIVDTPPARYLPDSAVINEYADGCLLVVRQDFASVAEINETIDKLTTFQDNLIGCVYNASIRDLFARERKYGYRYGYHYGKGGSK